MATNLVNRVTQSKYKFSNKLIQAITFPSNYYCSYFDDQNFSELNNLKNRHKLWFHLPITVERCHSQLHLESFPQGTSPSAFRHITLRLPPHHPPPSATSPSAFRHIALRLPPHRPPLLDTSPPPSATSPSAARHIAPAFRYIDLRYLTHCPRLPPHPSPQQKDRSFAQSY